MKPPESTPRWLNRAEAVACVDVLSLMRAHPNAKKTPTLAVLSPYRRQVRLLRETAEANGALLGNLYAFRAKSDDGLFGTVDSFQGNEADAVVISLVRNNSRSGQAALGFLSDERRMNDVSWILRMQLATSARSQRRCVRLAGHLPIKWVDSVLHRLKHEGPGRVLRHLSRLASHYPQIQEQVTYLQKRRELMDYPTYRTAGWPIGSGSVESGHKLVMQARLERTRHALETRARESYAGRFA